MSNQDVSRRTLLKGGGAALMGLTVLRVAGPVQAFPGDTRHRERVPWDEEPSDYAQTFVPPAGQAIPWLDQPPPNPAPRDHRQPAAVGSARLLSDTCQGLLLRPALRPAGRPQ